MAQGRRLPPYRNRGARLARDCSVGLGRRQLKNFVGPDAKRFQQMRSERVEIIDIPANIGSQPLFAELFQQSSCRRPPSVRLIGRIVGAWDVAEFHRAQRAWRTRRARAPPWQESPTGVQY